jgi:hypothetical protein
MEEKVALTKLHLKWPPATERIGAQMAQQPTKNILLLYNQESCE